MMPLMTHDFPHLDKRGAARQVDVSAKPMTEREALAEARVALSPEVLQALRAGELAKGDAIAVARVAGIMGAKETPRLLPLCHSVPLSGVTVDLAIDDAAGEVVIRATARALWSTGVEMEAMTAVSVAALALYDMVKARDKGAVIRQVKLLRKSGGRSGTHEAK